MVALVGGIHEPLLTCSSFMSGSFITIWLSFVHFQFYCFIIHVASVDNAISMAPIGLKQFFYVSSELLKLSNEISVHELML